MLNIWLIRICDFKRTHKLWAKNESVKYQNHFPTRRRTKKLSTLGNIEFSMLCIYIVLQGIIFGSLIPSSDAKLFPSHSSSNQIFQNSFTEGDKIRPHPILDVTLGQAGNNTTSQGKIFKKSSETLCHFNRKLLLKIIFDKRNPLLTQRQYQIIIDFSFNEFSS